MPRKPNYQFEKRQKELDRKVRKEEKLKRRQERTADDESEQPTESAETDRPLEA